MDKRGERMPYQEEQGARVIEPLAKFHAKVFNYSSMFS